MLYTTDNGAEIALLAGRGAMTPFKSEKGTTWEGGMRIPMIGALARRWSNPGTQYNERHFADRLVPTLGARGSACDIKER